MQQQGVDMPMRRTPFVFCEPTVTGETLGQPRLGAAHIEIRTAAIDPGLQRPDPQLRLPRQANDQPVGAAIGLASDRDVGVPLST